MYGLRKSFGSGTPLICSVLFVALVGCGGGGATEGSSSGGGAGGSTAAGSSSSAQRAGTPASATYTISWDAVSDPVVTGYRIYFNYTPIGSGQTPSFVDVTGSPASVKPGNYGILAGDTLYVAIASRGANGLESPVSSPASITVE